MTQILFTIAVVVIVLYGAKMLAAGRSSLGERKADRNKSPPARSADGSEDLTRCPKCGIYTVSPGTGGCDSCKGGTAG